MVHIKTTTPRFRTIHHLMNFLKDFTNYEQKVSYKYTPRRFNLKNMIYIMMKLGNPHKKFKSIHIAGTKGKGSTSYFISCLLQTNNLKVGLYLSPHITRINERIQIQNTPIENKSLIKIMNELAPIIIKMRKRRHSAPPTFFEIMTSSAFHFFAEEKVDFAVVEVGIGGRLDSTNIINPEISVICPVDYDHINILGRRLSDIAYEKAGIIKPQTPCVISNQRPSSLRVIKNSARTNKSPTYLLGKDFFAKNISFVCNEDGRFTKFDFYNNEIAIKDVQINTLGKFQAENAAVALQVFFLISKIYQLEFNPENIKEAFKKLHIPCRLQRILKNPDFFIDCAHNEISISEASKTIKSTFPHKKIIVIFGIAQDKSVEKILKILSEHFDTIIFTRYNNPRSFSPENLASLFSRYGKEILIAKDSRDAVQKAFSLARKDDLILCFGSVYLAGEVYNLF